MGKGGYVSVFFAVMWVMLGESGWAAWARAWDGGVVLWLCVLWDLIICLDGRSRYLYIVLGGHRPLLRGALPAIQRVRMVGLPKKR